VTLLPRNRQDWLFAGAWLVVVLLVYGLQAPNRGFYGPNHGWTSSHSLAIMRHATPANAFVGYALQYRAADGAIQYTYFDRYPPFVSVGMNALMSLSDSLPVQIALARAAMNAFYLGTVALAGWLAYLFLRDRWLALAAALLAFSGYELVFYKDMVHYDQPALLGNLLVLVAIARFKLTHARPWTVVAAGVIGVSLGRGYSTLVILGLWALWEFGVALTRREGTLRTRLLAGIRTPAALALAVGLVWALGWIGYNLTVEANQQGVSLMDTSIVDSATRRLPFFGEKEGGRNIARDVPPWGAFARLELWRLVRWTMPFDWDGLRPEAWLLGLLIVTTGAGYVARLEGPRAFLAGLTGLWGLVWLAFMINLTHGHDYTMMYAVGTLLVFYIGLVSSAHGRPRFTAGVVALAFVAVFAANLGVRLEVGNQRAVYTYDYERVRERIVGAGQTVHVNISDGECVIEDDFCYVLGFYLAEHFLGAFDAADYVLGRLPTYQAEPVALPADDTAGLLLMRDTLTPENTTTHLFDVGTAERLFVPEDAAPIVTFGESLTLESWRVPGPINVAPCERAHLETWWLATDTLPANYSLLLAMVDSGGETVTDSNYDLTTLATTAWQPDYFHLDARYVDVPCDTPPGEYPLVISVYEPGAPASLPVTGADGSALADFFYLTTLVVGVGD